MSKRIIEQKWFLMDDPFGSSRERGMVIISGSEDPGVASLVCDCLMDIWDGDYIEGESREAAKHIVDLHNASLETTDEATS